MPHDDHSVDWLTRLRWMLTSPERRLSDAEQRFFDAYCRGGAAQHRELVLPLDFFTRPSVREALLATISSGEEPPTKALEEAWGTETAPGERVAFYENLARFFSVLADPRTHKVNWQAPEGHLRTCGSKILD